MKNRREGIEQRERVVILKPLPKRGLVKSCNKNVARTSGLQSWWKVFESCSMVPPTTDWRHQLIASAALLYAAQLTKQ